MIFQGSGCLTLIRDELINSTLLKNWQMNEGSFPELKFAGKQLDMPALYRAVMDQGIICSSLVCNGVVDQCSLQLMVISDSSFSNSSFISTQLRGSHIRNTSFYGGSFRGCSGPRLKMDSVRLKNFAMIEPEISHGVLNSICAVNSSFAADHPSGITGLKHTNISDSLFMGCHISGTFFAFSHLDRCVFLNCVFSHVDWDLTEREDVIFLGCQGNPSGMDNLPYVPSRPEGSWVKFEEEILCG